MEKYNVTIYFRMASPYNDMIAKTSIVFEPKDISTHALIQIRHYLRALKYTVVVAEARRVDDGPLAIYSPEEIYKR